MHLWCVRMYNTSKRQKTCIYIVKSRFYLITKRPEIGPEPGTCIIIQYKYNIYLRHNCRGHDRNGSQ